VTADLILYTRKGCHLCDEMYQQLSDIKMSGTLEIDLVDIDEDPVTQKKYTLRIPVLVDADTGKILAEGKLNSEILLAHLNS